MSDYKTDAVQSFGSDDLLRVALNMSYWASLLYQNKLMPRDDPDYHLVKHDVVDCLEVIQRFENDAVYTMEMSSSDTEYGARQVAATILRNGVSVLDVADLANKSMGTETALTWGWKTEAQMHCNDLCSWVLLWLEGADLEFIESAMPAFSADFVSKFPQKVEECNKFTFRSSEIRNWMDSFEESSFSES